MSEMTPEKLLQLGVDNAWAQRPWDEIYLDIKAAAAAWEADLARIGELEGALQLAQNRIGHRLSCTDHAECKAITAALESKEKKP